jgi:hypothetical protein
LTQRNARENVPIMLPRGVPMLEDLDEDKAYSGRRPPKVPPRILSERCAEVHRFLPKRGTNENRSDRASSSLAFTCSGDM